MRTTTVQNHMKTVCICKQTSKIKANTNKKNFIVQNDRSLLWKWNVKRGILTAGPDYVTLPKFQQTTQKEFKITKIQGVRAELL